MNELLRAIPKVTELYDLPEVSDLREHYAPSSVTEWIRTVLEQLRSAILSGEVTTLPTLEELGDRICRVAARESLPSLRPVINATGVILHTNLGRGCLSDRAADAVYDIARGYSTLEYNVEAGHRGSRHGRHADPQHPGPGGRGHHLPRGVGGDRRFLPGAGYHGAVRLPSPGGRHHQ